MHDLILQRRKKLFSLQKMRIKGTGRKKTFKVSAKSRIEMLADANTFQEQDEDLFTQDPLEFPGYPEKMHEGEKLLKMKDAIVTGTMEIEEQMLAVGVLDSRFLMGSMGTVVGEKIVRITEYALEKQLPLLLISASGGARMQEGIFSLMQMVKTAAAVERYKKSGGFFISCLTNPTTGGVSASYASLGDIIMAEPKSLICFAGPRVIEKTIGQTLPEGFQKAEFLMEHGMIDLIVEREQMRETISKLLRMNPCFK